MLYCAIMASRSDSSSIFAAAASTEELEEGRLLTPKFDEHGLITAVATDVWSGEVIMVAHMNADALRRTIDTGEAWYFSRSRGVLWKKGEASGHTQKVKELWVDCDQDAVVLTVDQRGPGTCHTGRKSCFYRRVPVGQAGTVAMEFRDAEKTFDPKAVYGPKSD
jgi:phosphoribosyl-AMP cyclohydrolase